VGRSGGPPQFKGTGPKEQQLQLTECLIRLHCFKKEEGACAELLRRVVIWKTGPLVLGAIGGGIFLG